MADQRLHELLNHIHSLGVVSAPDQISQAAVKKLLEMGYIRQVWIGSYALTEAGEHARRGSSK
jgi:hypothetical protein